MRAAIYFTCSTSVRQYDIIVPVVALCSPLGLTAKMVRLVTAKMVGLAAQSTGAQWKVYVLLYYGSKLV